MGGLSESEQRQKLQSWKEIAAFLGKDVRTARRWNLERGLPVHRVPGGKGASVFAYVDELDEWLNSSPPPEQPGEDFQQPLEPAANFPQTIPGVFEVRAALSSRLEELPKHSVPATAPERIPHFARMAVLLGVAVTLTVALYLAGKRLPAEREAAPPAAQNTRRWMLAVLPFANLSADPKEQYFSDGLTEELIAQMARLNPRYLGVIAPNSVTTFQQDGKDIREAGHELGVDYVVEGSVRRLGTRAHITAQLIRVSDQTPLWAESYEADEENVRAVEAEVSRAIAGEIQIRVSPAAQARWSRTRPVNPQAYDAYLKGLYFRDRRGDEDLEKAIQYFKQATELDPQYADAFAGLASSYVLVNIPRTYLAPPTAVKALSLDPDLALPHATLGVYYFAVWQQKSAEKEFLRALELDPGFPTAHHWHAYNLVVMGRAPDAVEEMRRALQLDPLSLPLNRDLGLMLYWARDYDGATAQFKKTLEMQPNYHHTHCYLGRAYECQGRFALALAEYEKADSNFMSISDRQAALGRIYARLGRRQEALRIAEDLHNLEPKKPVLQYNLATIFTALGDKDRAFECLNKEAARGRGYLPYLPYDPLFEALRSDSRYPQLASRIERDP